MPRTGHSTGEPRMGRAWLRKNAVETTMIGQLCAAKLRFELGIERKTANPTVRATTTQVSIQE
ncbi:MAG TPA: hypothetical protein VIY86_14010 [Pirellulaceae bacterium]